MRAALLLGAAIAACGPNGEPMHGTATVSGYGASAHMVVGAVVRDQSSAGSMLVQMGSDNVDCNTDLRSIAMVPQFPSGTFVFFSASDSMVTNGTVSISTSVVHNGDVDGSNAQFESDGGADVSITSIGSRVVGTIDFVHDNSTVGSVVVSGSFEVKKCY